MRRKIIHRFTTLVVLAIALFQPVGEQKIKIALWGDSRENLDNACSDIAHILLYKITDWDFQIHCGDLTHDGTDAAWQRSLHDPGVDSIFVKEKFMWTNNDEFKSKDGEKNFDKYTAGILPDKFS